MGLAKYLTLKNEFEINNSAQELQSQLADKNISKFDVEFLGFREYKITAKLSVGIEMSLGSGFSLPICTSLKLEDVENKTKVKLKTSIRPELVIISLIWIVTIFFQFFSNTKIPIAITLVLFPLIIGWFWLIYRGQEESLHIIVEKYLKEVNE